MINEIKKNEFCYKKADSAIDFIEKNKKDIDLNLNNNNCLTIGNLENPLNGLKEEGKILKNRNISNLQMDHEINKIPLKFIQMNEENETTNFFDNKSETKKSHKIHNGKVAFQNNDILKKCSIREDSSKKFRKFNSFKSNFPVVNNYFDYKNFFYLTFEALKNNTEKKHIFNEIDVDKLYRFSIIHSIPYFKVKDLKLFFIQFYILFYFFIKILSITNLLRLRLKVD